MKLRQLLVVLAVASTTIAGVAAAVGSASAETAGDFTGSITGQKGSAWSNKCVDVAFSSGLNGTPIQSWDCNVTAAQRWTIRTDGTIRVFGKCMDVNTSSRANGAKVQLYDCNGTGAQQWRLSSAHEIVNPQANKCLDVTDWGTANGTRLQIWDCYGGANQKWEKFYDPPGRPLTPAPW